MDSRLPPAVPEVLDARFADLTERYLTDLQTLSCSSPDQRGAFVDFLEKVRRKADDELDQIANPF